MTSFNDVHQVAVIIADGELDSIQDWAADAVRHVKDLRAMGCTVKIKVFSGEHAWPWAEEWAEKKFG